MSKRFYRLIVPCVLLGIAATSLLAEHTRRWRQSTYEEFQKGKAQGVAVRSDGHLELAPKFSLLADADASYLWSLKTDANGVLYAGGGSPAKVFRFEGGGKPKIVFESTDLLVQSIAFDGKGALYVATSPDGKVYKVSASGEKSVFLIRSRNTSGTWRWERWDAVCSDGRQGARLQRWAGWKRRVVLRQRRSAYQGAGLRRQRQFAGGDGTERTDFTDYAQR